MHYLVVNLDKKEYFRPIALGAPHGSKYCGITSSYDRKDWQWLIPLAQFVELHGIPGVNEVRPRWLGSWAGDRVLILRGDDDTDSLVPEDLQAMKAIGAPNISSYKSVRQDFKDLTGELKASIENSAWMADLRYANFTQAPWDYSWLTPEEAAQRLDSARQQGPAFFEGYVLWLDGRYNLRPEVKDLVAKEAAAIVSGLSTYAQPAPTKTCLADQAGQGVGTLANS